MMDVVKSIKSDIWAILEVVSPPPLPQLPYIGHTILLLYISPFFFPPENWTFFIIYCRNSGSDFSSPSLLVAICLLICLVTWLEYFSDIYVSCIVKSLISFLRGCRLGMGTVALGWLVLVGLSLSIFLISLLSCLSLLVLHPAVRLH